MMTSGLAFVASHLSISGALPAPIIAQHVFRAATDSEIDQITKVLGDSVPRDTYSWVPYKSIVKTEHRGDSSTAFHYEHLPRDQWKYWVIAFEGQNTNIHDIELVAQMLPCAFDFGFVLFYELSGQQGAIRGREIMPLHVIERYSHPKQSQTNAEIITAEQLSAIGTWFDLYQNLPINYAFVKSALTNFADLRRIPTSSDLVIVGLFSIIESLITHAPRLSETLDSINHQITNKIILLRKKYSRNIAPENYFAHAAEENIWKKLYSYRSSVAHGTPISLEKSDLQVLKSREMVVHFLQDNIKELLQLGLHEPEFLFDLRRC